MCMEACAYTWMYLIQVCTSDSPKCVDDEMPNRRASTGGDYASPNRVSNGNLLPRAVTTTCLHLLSVVMEVHANTREVVGTSSEKQTSNAVGTLPPSRPPSCPPLLPPCPVYIDSMTAQKMLLHPGGN